MTELLVVEKWWRRLWRSEKQQDQLPLLERERERALANDSGLAGKRTYG